MAKNTWVAYIGDRTPDKSLSEDKIKSALRLQIAGYYSDQEVKIQKLGKAIFGQLIESGSKSDPVICDNSENQKNIYVTSYRNYFVSSYSSLYSMFTPTELYDSKERLTIGEEQIFGDLYDVEGPHEIYNNAFQKFRERGLEKLLRHGSFTYVNYNESTDEYFACCGKKQGKKKGYNPKIYYSFLNDDKTNIVMSNDRNVIIELGKTIYTLPDNAYMVNGEIKGLIKEGDFSEEKKSKDIFAETLNNVIKQMAYGSLKDYEESFIESLEEITEKYVNEFDINKIITKKQRDILIDDVKHAVLTSVRSDLDASNVVHTAVEQFQQQLNESCKQKIDEYMATIYVPKVHIITRKNNEAKKVEGVFHEKFSDILSTVELNEPTMLVGPAGSGKNVAVGQVADSLDLKMYYTNNANNEFKLLGYMDAAGKYHETPFYKAFTEGGVFFLDEIDASDPSALIVVNSGLANGYMFFPNSPEPVKMHPNFRIVAAANTWGKGADLQYVGRNALDGSTMDRFDTIFFDYDEKMESVLYPDNEVLDFMWNFRKAVFDTKTPHIVSTRGIGKLYSKKKNGISIDSAISQNVVKGLSMDHLSILVGKLEDMNTISEDNQYLENVKKLVLKKTPKQNVQKLVGEEDEYDLPF